MVAKTGTQNSYNKKSSEPQSGEDGFLKISLVNQAVFVRKRKSCPLKNIPISQINYKNLKLLNKFLTERGKIIPARATNVSMKKQKALANAIKIARHLALLSPIDKKDS
ncbi:MAG: rpsR [Rickettsiaceae bacterium]|jgi:small subunit ribosomal protein S18|nr:rpsR [Rickettsiaceae bacterium]